MLRPLLIGPDERAKAAAILAYSLANPYYPIVNDPPGYDPRHILILYLDYRVVFSLTIINGKAWRHLSVSIPPPGAPSVEAVKEIAALFGFSDGPLDLNGIPRHWSAKLELTDACVVVGEPYERKPNEAD